MRVSDMWDWLCSSCEFLVFEYGQLIDAAAMSRETLQESPTSLLFILWLLSTNPATTPSKSVGNGDPSYVDNRCTRAGAEGCAAIS